MTTWLTSYCCGYQNQPHRRMQTIGMYITNSPQSWKAAVSASQQARAQVLWPSSFGRASGWCKAICAVDSQCRKATSPGTAARRKHQAFRRYGASKETCQSSPGTSALADMGHTLSVSQPWGVGRIGATMRGSRKVPAFPVTQHLEPSRRAMAWLAAASGKGGGLPLCETSK